jgi:hypothetical protein
MHESLIGGLKYEREWEREGEGEGLRWIFF